MILENVLPERETTEKRLKELNKKYNTMSASERMLELYNDFPEDDIMVTSSFAATSALLLKLISEARADQKIYFIDTGYHFPETLNYKEELTEKYSLIVEDVSAPIEFHNFTTEEQTWKKDPNLCCSVNKVKPLETIKDQFKVWISGLMKWQSDHRASLDIFEVRGGILKFYPLLDVTKEQRENYIRENQLPFHPLVAKGYSSIGCAHCTVPGNDRNGRWNNNPKTECGLHL